MNSIPPELLPQIQSFFNSNLEPHIDFVNVSQAELLKIEKNAADEIIGAGVVVRNKIHSLLPRIVIAVAENERRKGLGTRIYQSLMEEIQIDPEIGIDGQCDSSNAAAIGFMNSLGFQHYLDCRMPIWDLSQVQLDSSVRVASFREYLQLGQGPQEGVSYFQSQGATEGGAEACKLYVAQEDRLSNAGFGDMRRLHIRNFLVTKYIETHYWNPVTLAAEDPKWDQIIFDRIDFDLSVVLLNGDQVLGVSTALKSRVPVLDIMWSFADGNLDEQEAVLKEMLGEQFKRARALGYTQASLEIDSTDLGLSRLLVWLPVISESTWCRFRGKG